VTFTDANVAAALAFSRDPGNVKATKGPQLRLKAAPMRTTFL
jgi:hypothetical protein